MRTAALRRLAIASFGAAASLVLFAPVISSALVTRGDEFLYRSQVAKARLYYRRAFALNPRSGSALDRYVFFGLQIRTQASLEECVGMTSVYLSSRPRNGIVLADRALCHQFLAQDDQARDDFERAARVTGDPRYYTLAGWAAQRHGRTRDARRLFRLALHAYPGFRPAQSALARLSGG